MVLRGRRAAEHRERPADLQPEQPLHAPRRLRLRRQRYLVNGAGYYLKGIAYDPITGSATSSNADVIRKPTTPCRRARRRRSSMPRPCRRRRRPPPGELPAARRAPSCSAPPRTSRRARSAQHDRGERQRDLRGPDDPWRHDHRLRLARPRRHGAYGLGQDVERAAQLEPLCPVRPGGDGAAAMWTRFDGTPAAPDFTFSPAGGGLTARPAGTLPSVTVNGVTIAGINLVTSSTSGSLTQVQSAGTAGQLETMPSARTATRPAFWSAPRCPRTDGWSAPTPTVALPRSRSSRWRASPRRIRSNAWMRRLRRDHGIGARAGRHQRLFAGGRVGGAVQHRHRGRVLQDDRHPAGLFGQHKGDHHLPADAERHSQHRPLSTKTA